MAGISSKSAGSLVNKEKTFQDQRFDDDLGLNWVQFKWRNHDPQIGRFIEIDPLSEKYTYNSTYAFSENKITNHVELEGLESQWTFFKTLTNYAGIPENETTEHFTTELVEQAKKPETYQNAILGLGQIVGTGLLIAFTDGTAATLLTRVGLGSLEVGTASTEVRATTSLTTLEQNVVKAKNFEQQMTVGLAENGNVQVSEQVTIRAANGSKTRLDAASKTKNGELVLSEAKSSETAPLTSNEKKAFPSIEASGGVVVGKGKPGLPGGTQIPPTKVDIVRPSNLADYLKFTYLRNNGY